MRTSMPSRRTFVQLLAMLAAGGQALWQTRDVHAAIETAKDTAPDAAPWPKMTYRTLGRTGYNASRLVFGCGAALSKQPQDALLERAFEAGVNVFDVGTSRYYRAAERNMRGFVTRHRDDIFLISKAMTGIDAGPEDEISVTDARKAAKTWTALMEESLSELDTDHVDAYYQMGANNPRMVRSEEMYEAFLAAQQAGKVSHYGVSTHENAARVLEAATESGWFSLAMIAVTPAGWYDWKSRNILDGTPDMKAIRPMLDKARAAGVGLIGMKAGRLLAGRGWLGQGNLQAFDRHYNEKLLRAKLSDFQRSYAYVLENGLDVVNADMQSYATLKENYAAAATAEQYVA
ncbi:MAG: aldo/keto reductase [Gammaproteobacteria bacterium]|nr:aldo/keto reductase [Gammaproteobacteria bacterium]